MRNVIVKLVFILVLMPIAFHSQASKWQVVTESFFPFSYYDGKELTGYSVDIVNLLMKEANNNTNIDILPWARAVTIADTQANVLIFSMLKTPSREEQYHWIGPITKLKSYLWALSDESKIDKNNIDWTSVTIGVLRNSSADRNLQQQFNVQSDNIVRVNSYEQILGLLIKKRVNLIALPEVAMTKPAMKNLLSKQEPLKKVVMLLDETLYLAASKMTQPEQVKHLQVLMNKMIKDGRFNAIHEKYLPILTSNN